MRSAMPVPSRPRTRGDSALRSDGRAVGARVAGGAAAHRDEQAEAGQRGRGPPTQTSQPRQPISEPTAGGHRHADQQGERLAAHHPAQRAAALAVGDAAGDLGERPRR